MPFSCMRNERLWGGWEFHALQWSSFVSLLYLMQWQKTIRISMILYHYVVDSVLTFKHHHWFYLPTQCYDGGGKNHAHAIVCWCAQVDSAHAGAIDSPATIHWMVDQSLIHVPQDVVRMTRPMFELGAKVLEELFCLGFNFVRVALSLVHCYMVGQLVLCQKARDTDLCSTKTLLKDPQHQLTSLP